MHRESATNLIPQNLPINKVVSYLERSGWMQVDHPNKRVFMFEGPLDDVGQPLRLVLPRDQNLQDAAARLAEAIELLTVVYEVSSIEIVEKILAEEMRPASGAVDRSERTTSAGHRLVPVKVSADADLEESLASVLHSQKATIVRHNLLRGQLGLDDPKRQILAEIDAMAQRLTELTAQLLLSGDSTTTPPTLVNVNEVVSEAEGHLRRMIREDIELVAILDPALKPVNAVHDQLGQLLMNLVANALDAMPSGGTLTIETRNAELDEGSISRRIVNRAGEYVVLSVSDNGIGIKEELQQRIFEPFFTTKEGKSTGLGLSVVRSILERSEGSISVESRLGRGTTFQIYLPRSKEEDLAQTGQEEGSPH